MSASPKSSTSQRSSSITRFLSPTAYRTKLEHRSGSHICLLTKLLQELSRLKSRLQRFRTASSQLFASCFCRLSVVKHRFPARFESKRASLRSVGPGKRIGGPAVGRSHDSCAVIRTWPLRFPHLSACRGLIPAYSGAKPWLKEAPRQQNEAAALPCRPIPT